MKIKKKIAGVLATVLIFSSFSVDLYANKQNPVTSMEAVQVSYDELNGPSIPIAKIKFEKPKDNTDTTGNTYFDKSEPDGYNIIFKNSKDKKENSSVDISKDEILAKNLGETNTLSEESELKPGQLYKVWVAPFHYHETYDNGELVSKSKEIPADAELYASYFVTEFDTTAKTVKNKETNQPEIKISMEYIPGATYEIYYEKARLNKISDIQKRLCRISADEYYDSVEDRVVYTFTSPEQGAEYSFYGKVVDIQDSKFLTTHLSKVYNIQTENFNNKTTVPKIVYAKVGTGVQWEEVGKENIQFTGTVVDSFKDIITSIEFRMVDDSNKETTVGKLDASQIISDGKGNNKFTFTYTKPTKPTKFLVVFHFNDGTTLGDKEDDIILVTPSEALSLPLRPQIPEASNERIVEWINSLGVNIDKADMNYKDYFLKGDKVLDNLKTNSITIEDTFHAYKENDKQGIQLIWSAQRKDEESIPDKEIDYDIWIFKDKVPKNYTQYEPLKKRGETSEIQNSEKQVIGFKEKLTTYNSLSNGEIDLLPNSTYYIIVRSKNVKDDNLVSDATIVGITIDKNGDISSPSVLSKPPLRVQEENVTEKMIPIEWQEQWEEVKAKDPSTYGELSSLEKELACQWNSWAYISETAPYLRWTGDVADRLSPLKEAALKEKLGSKFTGNYDIRKMLLGENIKYEVKAIAYDEVFELVNKMSNKIDYTTTPGALRVEKWISEKEDKNQNDKDFSEGWNAITPTQKASDNSWWQTDISQYYSYSEKAAKPFEPNKRYIIMVRTYREIKAEDGIERLYQDFPSYVIGITKNNFEEKPVDPSAPILHEGEVTSNSISAWWIYNKDFEYEVRYSRLEDPESAEIWEFNPSDDPESKDYIPDGGKAVVTITGLSPETSYNIWIRAKVRDITSGWSNAVTLKTTSIDAPETPRGLGSASKTSLLEIGKDNIESITSNSIVVEWLKIDADINNKDENVVYQYQVELADNKQFLDATTVTTGEVKNQGNNNGQNADADNNKEKNEVKVTSEILAKNIVWFKGLDANKEYYIRVKAILTYTDPTTKKIIVKESEFTVPIKLKTKSSSDEYDGGGNQNIVTYPEPIVETFKNDIWTYELVDAAKITTQILQKKEQYYTITMENYRNRYDALTRRVKMPVKIMTTIKNQGMSLRIKTNIGIYEISGQSLAHYLDHYQGIDLVQIDLSRKEISDIAMYVRASTDRYQKGEKLDIILSGNGKKTNVNTLDKPMTVKMRIEAAGAYNYSNYNTYLYNYTIGKWEQKNHAVDLLDNRYLTYTTLNLGLNALYMSTVENSNNQSTYIMNALTSQYNIIGLGNVYTQNATVNANQYVLLMIGIAKNKEINLTQGADQADYKAAKAAGLYNGNRGNVTREEALAGVVKLYEIKHGNKIKGSNRNFTGVSAKYSQAVSKAYAIGLIDSMTSPKTYVTYAELCDWIALAIE